MNNRLVVVSPKSTKESAMRLAGLLDADYISSKGGREDFTEYSNVINYGYSNKILCKSIINKPSAVKLCVNKISTLKRVTNGVEWTKDRNIALKWMEKDNYVVCREKEEGSRSEGIVIANTKEDFDSCPAKFWTRYFDHSHEVRINVYKGKILSVYEKVTEGEFFDFRYLTVDGEHKQVDEMIKSIGENIGIDLYGMDVLVNSDGVAKLLEVNSGASLMEETEEVLVPLLLKEFTQNA